MTISPATKKDLPEILDLQKRAYRQEAEIYDDFTIQPLHQTIESVTEEWHNGTILKATENGTITGSVRAYEEEGICYVGKLIVHPHHQNKGIGKQLLSEIEKAFPRAQNFELFTGHKSTKNLSIYERRGYIRYKTEQIDDNLSLVFLRKGQDLAR